MYQGTRVLSNQQGLSTSFQTLFTLLQRTAGPAPIKTNTSALQKPRAGGTQLGVHPTSSFSSGLASLVPVPTLASQCFVGQRLAAMSSFVHDYGVRLSTALCLGHRGASTLLPGSPGRPGEARLTPSMHKLCVPRTHTTWDDVQVTVRRSKWRDTCRQ